METSLNNSGSKCCSCARELAGPVNYCPYCGKSPFHEPVKTPIAPKPAEVSGADANVSESDQNVVKAPSPTSVKPQPGNTDADLDPTITTTNLTPVITTSPPSENVHKIPTIPGSATPTTHELTPGKKEKSRVGIYAIVALVIVAVVVGSYKLFSAKSSTKFAEVRIVSTPKGAAVMIDSTDMGDTPHTAANLTSGKHTIGFSKAGYQSRTVEVSLAEGKNPDVQVTLEKSPRTKVSAGEQSGATGGQPVSTVKPSQPEPTAPALKQAAPSPAKAMEKPMEERIQEAIALYESKQYTAATKQFKAILEVVPNNSVAKFYMQKSVEAGGQ